MVSSLYHGLGTHVENTDKTCHIWQERYIVLHIIAQKSLEENIDNLIRIIWWAASFFRSCTKIISLFLRQSALMSWHRELVWNHQPILGIFLDNSFNFNQPGFFFFHLHFASGLLPFYLYLTFTTFLYLLASVWLLTTGMFLILSFFNSSPFLSGPWFLLQFTVSTWNPCPPPPCWTTDHSALYHINQVS